LFDALAGAYSGLGFDALADEVFRDLVIARVVEPTSLSDVDRVLAEMGRRSVSLSTGKRTLKRCGQGQYGWPGCASRTPSPSVISRWCCMT
jgi:hypothetical protein